MIFIYKCHFFLKKRVKIFKHHIRALVLVMLKRHIVKKIILLFLNAMLVALHWQVVARTQLLESYSQKKKNGKLNFTRNFIFKKNLFNKIILN